MTNWEDLTQKERIFEEKQQARRHQQYLTLRRAQEMGGLTPLASMRQILRQHCHALPALNKKEAAMVISDQIQILEGVFITCLHSAGLGQENTLNSDCLKDAFIAQRLCRESVSLLHGSPHGLIPAKNTNRSNEL